MMDLSVVYRFVADLERHYSGARLPKQEVVRPTTYPGLKAWAVTAETVENILCGCVMWSPLKSHHR